MIRRTVLDLHVGHARPSLGKIRVIQVRSRIRGKDYSRHSHARRHSLSRQHVTATERPVNRGAFDLQACVSALQEIV